MYVCVRGWEHTCMYAGMVRLHEFFRAHQSGHRFRVAVVLVRVEGRVRVSLARKGGVKIAAIVVVGGLLFDGIETALIVRISICCCQHETLAYFNHHCFHNCHRKEESQEKWLFVLT